MPDVICQGGLLDLVNSILVFLDGLQIGLYNSPQVPSVSDTAAFYLANEGGFPGYIRQNLNLWQTPTFILGGIAQTLMDPIVWTQTGPGSYGIYGYFVVTGGGVLVWAGSNLSYPYVMSGPGARYVVYPKFWELNC
jgi:hypothetical protein